ncbi:AAA family ATPase [Patescibacteria group bacterium]|jgi:dephospho-CoA kinase|nr:AAA family ATPase [Patescibacteria group bacterium]
MTIIGITGTLGAGKGTVVAYLKERGFAHVSASDLLADEAERHGFGRDRHARARMANLFRSERPTKLMELLFERAVESDQERVIIEALHTKGEVEFVRSHGAVILAVDADLATRYERIHSRGSEKDQVSFEEFKDHQEKELFNEDTNVNNLGDAIAAADHHLTNNGSLDELHAQIDAVLAEIGL